jgi:hypothetical protein
LSSDCDGSIGNQITELLRKKGLLQATQGSHHKGFAAKGLPKYQIPDSPEAQEKIRKEIFDPLAKIARHVGWPLSEYVVCSVVNLSAI